MERGTTSQDGRETPHRREPGFAGSLRNDERPVSVREEPLRVASASPRLRVSRPPRCQPSTVIVSCSRSAKYSSLTLKRTMSFMRSFTGTLEASSVERMTSVVSWRSCARRKPTRSAVRSIEATHFFRSSAPPAWRSFETDARELVLLGALEVLRHRRHRLGDLTLEVGGDRELRDAQLDRREEPRLQARAGRHEVTDVEPGAEVRHVTARDERQRLRRRRVPRTPRGRARSPACARARCRGCPGRSGSGRRAAAPCRARPPT